MTSMNYMGNIQRQTDNGASYPWRFPPPSRPSVPADAYANTFAGIEGGLLYPPDESGGFSAPLKLPLSYNATD